MENSVNPKQGDNPINSNQENATSFSLEYKTPYNFDDLLQFLRFRALEGVEVVDDTSYSRTVRIQDSGKDITGWLSVTNDAKKNSLIVTISNSLVEYVPQITSRIRYMFDTDRDPDGISEILVSMRNTVSDAMVEGVLLPGSFDPFEIACRAVIGQQVTVKAANKIAGRIVANIGMKVDSGIEGLKYAWPTPEEIAAIEDIEETLGLLGVIKTRSRTIKNIADAIVLGELELSPDVQIEDQMERLLALKGIGPWTANYIAMRALGHTDAFLESDAGVAHALPELELKERLALAEKWRPWRSYAVITLWNSL